jgi:2-polyprenyl-3-methyl-5-hydroxy-6-metoxy-1,4-benzoquinol methylase
MRPTREAGSTPVGRIISGAANPAYAAFHRPRFAFVLDVLRAGGVTASSRILDIGASQLTSLIAKELEVQVESMGMEEEGETNGLMHHRFDLNNVQDRAQWKMDIGPYDIIVFAEVLEHLYTAPELVLRYLRDLMVPGGALLLQTPNAVALRKRVKMAIGANPFERIRVQRDNPGHFREYTASELRQVLVGAGFSIDRVWMQHYFDVRYARHESGSEPPRPIAGTLKNVLYRALPASLREGITILARRSEMARDMTAGNRGQG